MANLYSVYPKDKCEQCGSAGDITVSAGVHGAGTWKVVTRFWELGFRTVLAGTFHKPCVDLYIRENKL
jgi:hypothetical protein